MTDFSQMDNEASVLGAAQEDVTRCHDCDAAAPRTDTNFTLISSQHGWRLTLDKRGGRRVSVWRCPRCWKRHKEEKA